MDNLILVLTGIGLLLLAPLLQRFIGHTARVSLTIAGSLLELFVFLVMLCSGKTSSLPFWIAAAVIGWGILVYIYARIWIGSALRKPPKNATEHCVSRLVSGKPTREPNNPDPSSYTSITGVWAGIRYIMQCIPTDSSLRETLSAVGYDYYVLVAFSYKIYIDRTIDISCEIKKGKCKIMEPVSENGPDELKDRSLLGKIYSDIEYYSDRLVIVVTMGVSLDASTITVVGRATRKGISGTVNIKFPNASRSSPSTAMGTYVWKCFPPEGTGTGSGTSGTQNEGKDCCLDINMEMDGTSSLEDGSYVEIGYELISGTTSVHGETTTTIENGKIIEEDPGIQLESICIKNVCEQTYDLKIKLDIRVFDSEDNEKGHRDDIEKTFSLVCPGTDEDLRIGRFRVGEAAFNAVMKIRVIGECCNCKDQ